MCFRGWLCKPQIKWLCTKHSFLYIVQRFLFDCGKKQPNPATFPAFTGQKAELTLLLVCRKSGEQCQLSLAYFHSGWDRYPHLQVELHSYDFTLIIPWVLRCCRYSLGVVCRGLWCVEEGLDSSTLCSCLPCLLHSSLTSPLIFSI